MELTDQKGFVNATKAALIMGITDHPTIVSFADKKILETSEPSTLLVDISLSKDKEDLIHVLNQYSTDTMFRPDGRYYIAIIAQKYFSGKETLINTVRHLYRCIFTTDISEEEEGAIRRIESNFEDYTPMSQEDALKNLEAFLHSYDGLTFDSLFPA